MRTSKKRIQRMSARPLAAAGAPTPPTGRLHAVLAAGLNDTSCGTGGLQGYKQRDAIRVAAILGKSVVCFSAARRRTPPLSHMLRSSVRNIRFSVRCTVTDRATHKKCGFCQPPETAMSPSNADVWPWRLLGVCWLNLEQVCFCTRQCGSARHLPSLQRVPCHA